MGLFDFLTAPGTAQALSQFGTGQAQGQREALALHQQQQMMQFRQAQLQALNENRKQKLTLEQHAAQSRLVAPLIKQRYDAAWKGYWDRNPEDAAATDRVIAANSQGFAPDPNDLLSLRHLPQTPSDQPSPGGSSTGAAPPSLPPLQRDLPPPDLTMPASAAPPAAPTTGGAGGRLALPGGFSGVGAPTAPPDHFGLDDPLYQRLYDPAAVADFGRPPSFALGHATQRPTPIGPPIPAALLNRQAVNDIRSGGPGGANAPAFPSTDTSSAGTGATEGTGATAPVDPTQDPHNPLYAGFLPHETDQGRAQRIGSAAKTLVAQIGASRFAAQYPGLAADSALKGLKLEAYPVEETARIGGMVAGTNLKRAQQKALEAFAPIRDDDLRTRIQHVKTKDELDAIVADATMKYHDALVGIGQERNRIASAGQKSTAGLNSVKVQQINQAISQSAGSKDDASDRSILTNGLKALTSQKKTASGASVPFLSADQAATWQARVDSALARMQARQAARGGGATTAPAGAAGAAAPATRPQRGQPGYEAWLRSQSTNPGTVIRQPGAAAPAAAASPKAVRVSPEVQSIVGQLINSHRFDAEMSLPDYQDPSRRLLMKRAYLQVTGRNWTGGR